ncbi:MAG: DUF4783 domain-containing protein [Ferruginibacter sp.]
MKKIFTFIILSILLSSFTALPGIEEIVIALKGGNVAEVSKFFDTSVEITISDKSERYNKSQAEAVLRNFFNSNPISGFTIIHQGENAGAYYCIGTLNTRNASYRTTVYMKLNGDKQSLKEIRFENR